MEGSSEGLWDKEDRGSNILGSTGHQGKRVNFGKTPSSLKNSEHCYVSEKWCRLEAILMMSVCLLVRMLSALEFLGVLLGIWISMHKSEVACV